MIPFRFADAVFNPQFIINAHKENRKLKNGKFEYFVVIVFTDGATFYIRTIDEVEQEGTLKGFHNTWASTFPS